MTTKTTGATTVEELGRPAMAADSVTVLADLTRMLRGMLGEYGLEDAEISRDTTFHNDLEMESIDLVALSGMMREHYGERVNFAEFIADLELDEIIALAVGELVDYIVASLRATES